MMSNAVKRESLAWALMLGLMALYAAGFFLGWAATASWHLLAVIAAILLIYNVLSLRGR